MKKIKVKITKLFIIFSIILILLNITAISANDQDNIISTSDTSQLVLSSGNQITVSPEQDLKQIILDSNVNDVLILEPGTYKVHDVNITKNITLQGNGNPRDIIIDGEKKDTIFLVESSSVHARFNNITFINGVTMRYGGAISMYSGSVYIDNCHFINNSALGHTAGGAIANFGIDNVYKQFHVYAYLFVNNSFFINNYAEHDGGAITTDFSTANIYNSVFINNSAGRDGGAIRINREGRGNVQDCIFMFNYAEEWGGAYYSWVGVSNIERCVFMNNTAGTNGGAIMASANINVTDSIIVNNTGKAAGGALYIGQPMNRENAGIILRNNLITDNYSPYGKEIAVKWREKDNKYVYPYWNSNDWGDEDPNDPSIVDPNNVIMSKRRTITSTIKSNLLEEYDMGLMDKYDDLIRANLFKNAPEEDDDTSNQNLIPINSNNQSNTNLNNNVVANTVTNSSQTVANSSQTSQDMSSENTPVGDSTSVGDNMNAYELNEKNSVAKQASPHIEYFLAISIIVFLALFVGYRQKSNE